MDLQLDLFTSTSKEWLVQESPQVRFLFLKGTTLLVKRDQRFAYLVKQ